MAARRKRPSKARARQASRTLGVAAKKARASRTASAKRRGVKRPPANSGRSLVLDAAQAVESDRAGIASTKDQVTKLSDEQARSLALTCRDAASAKKAEDVLMLDIRDKAAFADFFILATGRSAIQARAIADAVVEAGEDEWGSPLRTEGYKDATWILVDYGAVIVHVFTPQAREFYSLERLWGKPPSASKRRA
jgi:ribosome-associated protein